MEARQEAITFDQVNDDDPKTWRRLERSFAIANGDAAAEHLAAGRPIYYADPTSDEYNIREWPDGRKERIILEDNDEITVIGPVE